MKTNYHTHTFRCKHASGTDRDYVEAAVANGFSELGFQITSPTLIRITRRPIAC